MWKFLWLLLIFALASSSDPFRVIPSASSEYYRYSVSGEQHWQQFRFLDFFRICQFVCVGHSMCICICLRLTLQVWKYTHTITFGIFTWIQHRGLISIPKFHYFKVFIGQNAVISLWPIIKPNKRGKNCVS